MTLGGSYGAAGLRSGASPMLRVSSPGRLGGRGLRGASSCLGDDLSEGFILVIARARSSCSFVKGTASRRRGFTDGLF